MAPKMHHGNMLFKSRFLMIHNTQFNFSRHSSEPLNNLLFHFPLFIADGVDHGQIWAFILFIWTKVTMDGVGKICWITHKKKQSNSHRKQSSSYWSLILLDLCVVWECIRIFFFTFHKFILFFRIHGWILLRYILPFQWFFSSLHC